MERQIQQLRKQADFLSEMWFHSKQKETKDKIHEKFCKVYEKIYQLYNQK